MCSATGRNAIAPHALLHAPTSGAFRLWRMRPAGLRVAVLAAMLAVAGTAVAQSTGGDFTLKKSVIAGGSATAGGGDFQLAATAGQHDAGVMQGGDFTVRGGFWPAGAASVPNTDGIFADGFE